MRKFLAGFITALGALVLGKNIYEKGLRDASENNKEETK